MPIRCILAIVALVAIVAIILASVAVAKPCKVCDLLPSFNVTFSGMPSNVINCNSYLRVFGPSDGASDYRIPTSRNSFYCADEMEIRSIAVFRSSNADPESSVNIYCNEIVGPTGKFDHTFVGTKLLTHFSDLPFTIPRNSNIYVSVTSMTAASSGCVNLQLVLIGR